LPFQNLKKTQLSFFDHDIENPLGGGNKTKYRAKSSQKYPGVRLVDILLLICPKKRIREF